MIPASDGVARVCPAGRVMIVKSSVQELFPTPLWVADLPSDQALSLNSKLKTLIYGLADRPPNLQVGATWQTDPNLQQRAEFDEFIGLVNLAARSALEFLQVRYDGFEVTRSEEHTSELQSLMRIQYAVFCLKTKN